MSRTCARLMLVTFLLHRLHLGLSCSSLAGVSCQMAASTRAASSSFSFCLCLRDTACPSQPVIAGQCPHLNMSTCFLLISSDHISFCVTGEYQQSPLGPFGVWLELALSHLFYFWQNLVLANMTTASFVFFVFPSPLFSRSADFGWDASTENQRRHFEYLGWVLFF